jgi:hypothetical protein
MSAPRKFDEETRARAVRLYQDRLRDHGESKLAARKHVGALLDINRRRCGTGSRLSSAPRSRPAWTRRILSMTRQSCGGCVRKSPSCGGRMRS